MKQFGLTRTVIKQNHAFIAPDGHVPISLPGWTNTQAVVLISPHLGANFTMSQINMGEGATAGQPLPGVERFVYLLTGQLTLLDSLHKYPLTAGSYAYTPPNKPVQLVATAASQLILFEKRYEPLASVNPPTQLIVAHENQRPSAAFLGDPDAQLKLLLPDEPAFDMAINLFTFQPGTTLPFVETHIMEHGMIMVEGGGVYRLDEQWYPIQQGDVLWMGPYCPQWFAALGKPQSTYLYYKNMNRDSFVL